MIDATNYTITIRKGEFEGEVCFQAKVAELPDIADYADTYQEAYDLVIDSIETTAKIFAEKGKTMPAPILPIEDFSGRVTLRLPKSLHRSLAMAADFEGVSLNQHLVTILSYCSGFSAGNQGYENPWQIMPVENKSRSHLTLVKSFTVEPKGEWKKAQ